MPLNVKKEIERGENASSQKKELFIFSHSIHVFDTFFASHNSVAKESFVPVNDFPPKYYSHKKQGWVDDF